MTSAIKQAPLRLFLVVAVALCGLMTVADLPSPSSVHAQEQQVTATRDATGDTPPERPADLQASASHDSVSLTWTASTDDTVTHYAVLRRDRNADIVGVFHVIDSNAGPGLGYTDDSVSPEGSYVYRVKAVSPTGVSQWSSYVSVDTPADPADLAPSGLSAKAVSGDDGVIEGVALAWDAPAEDAASVTGYEVLRAVGDGDMATLVADTGSADTTHTDDTATEAGERYAYRVKALRGEEASQPSDRAVAIIPKTTPGELEPPIAARQNAADTEVPANWSLIPTGLDVGGRFRLIFISSGRRNGSSTDIADYNTFVQTAAAAGHADVQGHSSTFRVVGSTAGVDARDNTSTTYDADDKGVPIYWLGGNKVADQYQDFYDGRWDDEANAKDEFGNDRSTAGESNYPITGSAYDGTADAGFLLPTVLGASNVMTGRLSHSPNPLQSDTPVSSTASRPMYGLSGVFVVSSQGKTGEAPAFALDAVTRGVPENSDGGVNVGDPVTATDGDGDTLTYRLEGADAASFAIDSASGQIQTKSGVVYDFEGTSSYAVTVRADDGNGGRVTTAVTINLTDVDEPPTAPGAPIAFLLSGATDTLSVRWTAPDNTGKPDIESYDLRYRKGSSGDWSDGPQDVTGLEATITGLDAASEYQVQVRATNDEGTSDWSASGYGSTSAQFDVLVSNVGAGVLATKRVDLNGWAQSFDTGSNTEGYDFKSILLRISSLGSPGATTASLREDDGGSPSDTALYTLTVPVPLVDDTLNAFTAPDGASLDANTTYWFVIKYVNAQDQNADFGGPHFHKVRLTVGLDPGAAPGWNIDAPAQRGGLSLFGREWAAPDENGAMKIQVLGRPKGEADANNSPAFPAETATRELPENSGAGVNVGAAVTATDADTGATLTYNLEGNHGASFDIDAASGQIKTKAGVTYDYEARSSYLVTVKVRDGNEGADTIAVTINLTDVDEPPAAPDAPTVMGVDGSGGSLSVSWVEPDTTGIPSDLTYDLQYRKTGITDWTDGPQDETGTSATITGLDAVSEYQVQVRATSHEGTSDWSASGTGSTEAEPVPANWGLIPSELSVGDRFRLIFITSGTRDANSTDIADYNTFVQTAAAAGHAGIQDYSSTFRVVGSTADVDARDNTYTTHTADNAGVAIYWLGGAKVADDYAGFYDGEWDDEANARDESGNVRSTSGSADWPFTGSTHDGIESFNFANHSKALGANLVRVGQPNDASGGPLSSDETPGQANSRPFYGLSAVFVVQPNAAPAFTSEDNFSVEENQTAAGTVAATDPDAVDTVTYAVTGGADQAHFRIGADSGVLIFASAPDHESPADAGTNNVYQVTVTATGGTGNRALTATQDITVTVTDVDETPEVDSVEITSTPTAATDIYGAGETIKVTVTFDQAVTVTGTPRIKLRGGGGNPQQQKWADYAGGTGSAALVFAYVVQAGDRDANGVYIQGNELELNGGTIQGVDDDVAADLDYATKGTQSGHEVDGSLSTTNSASTDTEVPADWGLIPGDLGPGDRFRLIFISSNKRDGSSTDIDVYNTFVQTAAGGGHTDIRDHSSTFRAVGSTAAVDARDNTDTRYTGDETVATNDDSDLGVAIYWLGGNKVADNYKDFYDEDWDDEDNAKDQSGADRNTTSIANWPITGSEHDGTERVHQGTSRVLGADDVQVGRLHSTGGGPLNSVTTAPKGDSRTLYGLSGVFVVGAASTDATLSALSLSGVTLSSSFAADTLAYTASVDSAVDSTTVTATANDDGAAVVILPADADAATDGHQVELGVGTTIVSVTVTAADGTTTQTYTATVTRAAPPAPIIGDVTVSSLPGADQTYAIGDTIQVTVTFDAAVTVTGTPRIQLRVGGGDPQHLKWADYASGTGNEALVFAYTVQAGDEDTNGIFIAENELELNGGTIQSAGGTDAILAYTGPGTQSGHKVDGVRPTPELAATSDDGASIIILFSEPLAATTAPASAFTLAVDTGTAPAVSSATASGDRVTLALASALTSDQAATVTVSYADTAGDDSAAVQDPAGNDAAGFTTGSAEVPDVANAIGAGCSIADGCYVVPAEWSLIPDSLDAGDRFRLLFLSSTTRNARSTDIDVYNTWIQDRAAAGHTDIQDYSSIFRVVGSTAAVDARDNTATRYTGDDTAATDDDSDLGVAIYWLDGNKVADEYKDFYDGEWADEANAKDESGNGHDTSAGIDGPFTGSNHDGTESFSGQGSSRALGANSVQVGQPNDDSAGPLSSGTGVSSGTSRSLYGLSAVFRVEGQTTTTNAAPMFDVGRHEVSRDENKPANELVVSLVEVTDADNDTLTFSIEGDDAASFRVDSSSGQVRTIPGVTYDYEAQSVYTFTLRVEDGNGGTDTLVVTVNLNDVDEPPSAPAAPAVEAVDGTNDSLSVTWTAPDNTGKPDIESYDLQYRKTGITGWTDGPQDETEDGTDPEAIITGLDAGMEYQVQVRATNDEGDSLWSAAGSGSTNAPAVMPADTVVPADWSLIPDGLVAGDRFRLVFLSSTTRNGSSTNIADYNTFVQNAAAAGHTDIQGHSSAFRVVGSTAAVDARDNTATRYTGDDTAATDDDSDLGVAIYWLGGAKVADQYKDFYDGGWDNEANAKDESGSDRSIAVGLGNPNLPFTGSDHDGTEEFSSGASLALGAATHVRVGQPNSPITGSGPLSSHNNQLSKTLSRPLYGLSGVFVVGGVASTDATLSALSLSDSTLSPSFAPDMLTYSGSVRHVVTRTTVTATPNDDRATVAITATNANGAMHGHRVVLAVGDTVVSVKVTAEDGTTTQTYMVTVTRSAAEELEDTVVPADWGLIPSGLGAGDRFRLIFISKETREATAISISEYDDWIQDQVAAGHIDIQEYSSTFRVVGSTAVVDARDNTTTRYTGDDTATTNDDSDLGVAIYWLDGAKVADEYRDFYDGSWADETNAKDESGDTRDTFIDSGLQNLPSTGSDHDGTEAFDGGNSRALGASLVRAGEPNSNTPSDGPLSGSFLANDVPRPFYGLSGVFVVSASTVTEIWSTTLTVQEINPGSGYGCNNEVTGKECSTHLDDDRFTYNGNGYQFTALLSGSGELTIVFAGTPGEDLNSFELNADGNIFSFQNATMVTSRLFTISLTGFSPWPADTEVSLSITANVETNVAPTFPGVGTTREVAENSPAGADVGEPVTAEDANGDTLTYTLEGTDAASFDFDASTGQIRTKSGVTYSYEFRTRYSVTVKADDGNGETATIAVTINITDVDEPPSAPAAPALEAVDGTNDSLLVSWTAPDNGGKPGITSYDLQYRKGTTGDWTDGPQDETGLSATITGLDAGTEYQVQVRATNDEGDGDWSASGSGSTTAASTLAIILSLDVDGNVTVDSQGQVKVSEDYGDLRIGLRAEANVQPTEDFEVTLNLVDVSTIVGSDYRWPSSTFAFSAAGFMLDGGRYVLTVSNDLEVIDEDIVEMDQQAVLEIDDTTLPSYVTAGGGFAGHDGHALTILDDDEATVSMMDIVMNEGEQAEARLLVSHQVEFVFHVTLLILDNQSHQSPDEFEKDLLTVNFESLAREATFTVESKDNSRFEPDQTFEVELIYQDTDSILLDEDPRPTITVREDDNAPTEVPANWSLVPGGLDVGDRFRLLFRTSDTSDASSSDIAYYNTFVQTAAGSGHADIQGHSAVFKVLGSTSGTDARDNTNTTYAENDKGVRIYWLNGNKVADDYEDFYDGSWSNPNGGKDENGLDRPNPLVGSNPGNPAGTFTGSQADGTEDAGHALGATRVTLGQPLTSMLVESSSNSWAFYGLSGVFVVGSASTDATLSALSLSGVTLSPGFAADTLTYTASVDYAVDSTTVTATPNDDGATVATLPADADATTDGHQVALAVGDTTVSVTVTAADGTTTQTYTVTVTRADAAPELAVTITADPTTVNGFGTVQLNTTVTGASGTVSYAWSGLGRYSNDGVPNPVWTAHLASSNDVVTILELLVLADGVTAHAEVSITVRGNQAPEVSLEDVPTEVDGGEEVSLTAAATDPEGDGLTSTWTSNAGGSFDDASAASATWTAPDATRQQQPVTLTLTVTDDGAGTRSTTQTLSLTVRANEVPTGSVSANPETVLGGQDAQLTVGVTDPENDDLTYSWGSSGGGTFDSTAVASYTWTAPDATTADQTVTLTLTVTDKVGDTAFSTDVTVRENQPPEVSVSADPTSVAGGGTVTLDGTASDPEGDTLTYAWTSDGGGTFDDAGALDTTWTAPGATDTAQTIMLTLTVTDDGAGTRSASVTAVVTVKAQSQLAVTITADPATVDGGGTVQLNSMVTGASGAVTYSWSSGIHGMFSSTSSPNPVWSASSASFNNYEVPIRLLVFDSTVTVDATMIITVRANQAPEVSVSANPTSVAGGGTVTLDGTASDPEGDTLTYAWTSNGGGSFDDAGALDTTWTAPGATDAAQTIMLTLTVTDDGVGTRSASDTVTVTVEAQGNAAPEFSAADATREVPENTGGGENVGAAVTATDADNDTLTYTLEGDDALSFGIDSSTGQITTIAGVTYDHEAKSSYSVTVKADDSKGGTDTIAVTVNVTDVDEPPSAPGAPSVSAVVDSTTSLLVTWTAPDNTGKPDIESYDLQYRQGTSGNWTDGPQDETGLSATISGLDADSAYQVQVRATNDEGNSDWSTEGTGSTNAPPAPAVDSVAASSNPGADETYAIGDTIRVTVAFTEDVTVNTSGGTPRIRLRIGGGDPEHLKWADYTGPAATAALLFAYTVQAGDEDTNGIFIAADELELNGGTVQSTEGTDAELAYTEPGTQSGHKVDGVRPTPVLAATSDDGASIIILFSEPLHMTTAPASAFTLAVDTGTAPAVSSATASGDKVTFGLDSALTSVQAVTVTYLDATLGDDSAAIQDAAGNDAANFTTGQGSVPAVVNAVSTGCSLADGCYVVPANWGLIPSGLGAGAEFRLLFRSSTTRDAQSANIADYNTFVQDAAAAGHADIQVYSFAFKVLGSTADIDARDNTATTYTAADKGVAIYWLGGAKVADDYEDFYDGSWSNANAGKNELGANRGAPVIAVNVTGTWTGSTSSGTEVIGGGTSFALGQPDVRIGQPLGSNSAITSHDDGPFYGLSPVFRVSAQIDPQLAPTVSAVDITSTPTAATDTYGQGETIRITVTFRQTVTVTGTPRIQLRVGGGNPEHLKWADYAGGTGTTALVFAYTVQSGDMDDNGIYIEADELELNGGTIQSGTGITANLDYPLQGQQNDHKVDGSLTPTTNNPPEFTTAAPYLANENQTGVGIVEATDSDAGDTVSYAVTGGVDQAHFEIGSSTGLLSFATAPDHENPTDADTNNIYQVTVTATGGTGARELTVTQDITVTVTDVDEPPSAPAAPAVSPVSGSSDSLSVTWTAPDDTGKPDIESYDLQYRQGTSGSFTDGPQDVTFGTVTIGGLAAGTEYQVRVRATNDEGDSVWSSAGTGSTNAADCPALPAGRLWSACLTAGMTVQGHLGYREATSVGSLSDTDFEIGGTTYTVTWLTDSDNVSGFTGVRINLEPALAATDAGALTLHIGDATSLAFADATATVLLTLSQYTWSRSDALGWSAGQKIVVGITQDSTPPATNAAPVFTSAAAFSADENQTAVGTVMATDADAGDTVTYAVTGGDDQARFQIDPTSGVLTFTAAPDHESPADDGTNNVYQVTVTATGGTGGRAMTATQDISVTVNDVDETPAVTDVDVTSTPTAAADTYGRDETIEVTVTFDQAVTVTGTPRIQLRIGGGDPQHLKWADYAGGTGTTALVFAYTVQAGDQDYNGIFIEANELFLNSGTIQGVDDDVAATLTYTRQGTQSGHKVDGSGCLALPAGRLWSACLTAGEIDSGGRYGYESPSVGSLAPATFDVGATTYTVTRLFDNDQFGGSTFVRISLSPILSEDDARNLTLHLGDDTSLSFGDASYSTGSSFSSHNWSRSDALGWSAGQKIVVGITQDSTPPATNAAPVFTSAATFTADEDQTAVGTVIATDADAGDTVTYATTGGADQARFQIGPDSGVLTFATAPDHEDPGDADTNNVYQVTVTATGGTGARAMTATQAITVTVNDVDETPAITSVSVVSDPGADDTYGLGDTIEVQVVFDQAVTVNTSGGAPSIEFEVGGNQSEHLKLATYADGSGTTTLRFDYVVQSGDMDDNGIWLKGDKLELNGGTIQGVDDDVAANLDYSSLGRQDDHKVDGSLTTAAGCGTLPAGRLWSACMTVGTFTVGPSTVFGWHDGGNYTGSSLTDEDFDYGGDTYNLRTINLVGGNLTLAFDDSGAGDLAAQATRDKLTLHVGDTDTFNLGDGTLNAAQTRVVWANTGLTWADGDTVALSINVPAAPTPVPTTWSLVPSGLGDGDSFRLLFIGTSPADARYSDIAVYNTFIQNLAAAGHTDIQAHSATFRVVGSTEDVDARDNTGTTGTGVPIYWLNGAKVADDYADFYDGDWDEEREIARETGELVNIGSDWKIWTGSAHDGTEAMNSGGTESRALGNAGNHEVMQGSPNGSDSTHGPIESDTASSTTGRGLYGLSGVFTVDASLDPVNTPPTFQQENTTREVEENSPAGTAVGDPVTATDADDDTLTYTLEGPDAASFEIDSTSGQIQTKSGITYDYETKEEYAVTVRADDGKGGTDTIAVAIDLLDVDETAPTPGVSSVDVTSTPTATADTYGWNETIEVTVTFDQAVRVTGTPRILLRIGGGQPQHRMWADYAGGTGTTALRFTYVVQAGDMDDDGIYIEANELVLNGGTILSVDDDVAAVLDYARLGTQSEHKVDGSLTTIVPGTPTGLSATAAGQTVVNLSWTAPDGPVTGYRIEYRPEGGSWTDVEADTGSPASTYRHQELDPGTTYEYRVSAINPAGTGTASNTASATTDEQGSPVFTSGAAFSVEENETAVGTVTAADPDPGDTVRYAITGGDDRADFQIDPASGALTFMTSPDYERPGDADENNVYQVTVTATGGEGARALTADQAITVTVTGVNEPPGKPVGPWASWLVDSPDTLSVRWYAPHWGDESESFGKPPITSYQVRYQKGDIDDWGKWEKWEEWTYWPDAQGIPTADAATNSDQTEFSVYIDGLEPGATYQLQVRAINDDGAGVWSNRGSNRKPTGPVAEVDVNGDGIVDADPVITLPVGGAATYRVRPGRCEGYKSLNAQALRGTTENAPQHIPVDVSPADVYMTCAGEDDPGEWQEITLTGPSDELLSTSFEASVLHTVMYQQRSHESWTFLMSWGHLVTAVVPAPETMAPVGSLTVTAEEGRDRPHVTWNAVSGAPYYQVQWRWGPDEEWGPFQSQGGATYTRQKETEETAYTIPISGTVPTVNDVKRTQDVMVRVRPFDYDSLAVGPWREVTLPGRAVRPPEIIGTARVGETLTADTSPITRQSAALANAAFSYQWLRTGGADGYHDIPGATGSTYTLTPYDEVRRIKVRVTFTNEEGEEETQTSSVTAKVAPADADASEVALPASAAVLAGFSLVDAGASPQTLLAEPMDGASVEVANPDGGSYAIRADLNEGHTAGSVALELTGRKSASTTEGVMPYSLYGDDGAGALRGEALPAGSYVLTMTAYEGSGGGGAVLHTLEVSFTVTAAAEEPGTGQEDEEEENTAPLTALFLYEEPLGYHSGAGTTLTVRLSFSEAVSITPEALEQALAATNATVEAVSRVDGRSDLWEVRLTPHSDATVTLLLPLAADCDAAGAVCTGDGRAPAHAIGTAIPGPLPNSQATGGPTIDGVAEVGQVLSADVTGIDDDNAAFSYQWLRSDGGDYTEIEDATGSTYTLVAADQGKTIKVKVSFTDDEGNPETLTSDPTGEVEAAETVPGRPQDLEGEASAQGIALTWNAPVDSTVTSYVIYRAVLDQGQLHGKPMTKHATIDATGAEMAYFDADAEAGVEYRYRVAAVNSAGEGKKSTWINIFAEDS